MKQFDDIWRFLKEREQDGIPLVQIEGELRDICALANECATYLEIGSAEGNTLYAVGNSLKGESPMIAYVDIGEDKTAEARRKILRDFPETTTILPLHANSHNHNCIAWVQSLRSFDMVMIDACHDYTDVVADAMSYGGLARKYIVFHDIMMPSVRMAFDWYTKTQRFPPENVTIMVAKGSTYGYGVIKA